MNQYKISYYRSGGYRATGVLDTEYTVKKAGEDDQLCLFDKDQKVGEKEQLKMLFLDQLGWRESIMIFEAELLDNHIWEEVVALATHYL